jgi:hypothetical protein
MAIRGAGTAAARMNGSRFSAAPRPGSLSRARAAHAARRAIHRKGMAGAGAGP